MRVKKQLAISQEETKSLQSKSRRIAEYLDHIEELLAAGIPRTEILNRVNNAEGFVLSLSYFDTILKRLRKRKSKGTQPPASHSLLQSTPGLEHSRRVHAEFRNTLKDRPQKVVHDLNKIPDW